MFSGIIQAKSSVLTVSTVGSCKRVRISKPRGWKLVRGQSVSIDGICSTVTELNAGSFTVEYMPETLSKTTAENFAMGTNVNLERSLRYGDYVDGHFVQGHVDCVGKVVGVVEKSGSREVTVQLPQKFAHHVALHGSIAIQGVSLTVARKKAATLTVALIPFTLEHTNLSQLQKRSLVNMELDHGAPLLKKMPRGRLLHNAKKRI